MTESQAWLTIAEAFYTPREERPEEPLWEMDEGLCMVVKDLYYQYKIDDITEGEMSRKIGIDVESYTDGWSDGYFCDPHDPANDLLRGDYCYLQHLMTKGE